MSPFKTTFGITLGVVILVGGPLHSRAETWLAYISPEQFINSFADEGAEETTTPEPAEGQTNEPEQTAAAKPAAPDLNNIPIPSLGGGSQNTQPTPTEPETFVDPFQGNVPIPGLGNSDQRSDIRSQTSEVRQEEQPTNELTNNEQRTASPSNTVQRVQNTTTRNSVRTTTDAVEREAAQRAAKVQKTDDSHQISETSQNEQRANKLTNNESSNQQSAPNQQKQPVNELTNNEESDERSVMQPPLKLRSAGSDQQQKSLHSAPPVAPPPPPVQANVTRYQVPPIAPPTVQPYQGGNMAQQYPHYATTDVRSATLPDSGAGTMIVSIIALCACLGILMTRARHAYTIST